MRRRAMDRGTSLNDAITSLIRADMDAHQTPPPAPPAPQAKPPAKSLPTRRARKPTLSTAERARTLLPPTDDEPIPGQTAITDPDQ